MHEDRLLFCFFVIVFANSFVVPDELDKFFHATHKRCQLPPLSNDLDGITAVFERVFVTPGGAG